MIVSSATQWWEEWQLRILVLGSLFVQYFLNLSLWVRRDPRLRRFRGLVWIAYIGGDALAIYALATLFNRRKQTLDGKSSALEVLWAPVLLIHLAGQPWISAYSLEDNELWKRHTVTLMSQVTVALYVFCKWWSGDKRLLAAAVLLFVVGILKFAQKPWALKTASFNSMQASGTLSLHGPTYLLEEYVQEAKKCVLYTKVQRHYVHTSRTQKGFIFIDQSAPYSLRIQELSSFLKLEHKLAYSELQDYLGSTFDILYTRLGFILSDLGFGSTFLLPFLAIASVVLFATRHKNDGHNKEDIRVTYILICCTTVLEFLVPCGGICSAIGCWSSSFDSGGWHNMVSQYSLMSFCVHKKKPTFLMKLATFNFLSEFINKHSYIQNVPIASEITGVVRQHVEDGWKNYIRDAASYQRFNELRGQWALRRHHQLEWSLKMSYDESVLIWHIATDLCFYHNNTSAQCQQSEATQCSRKISNYMIYLLLIRPEMLMPGTRSDLFMFASEKLVEKSKGPLCTEQSLAQEILNMPLLPSADDMISNACNLAKALMELGNEEERWTVIQGVWVEMLCYSANRCRGYLHAKSLGDGGECLTIICILLSYMGMETLADRHQRSVLPQEEGEEVEEASTSRSQGRADRSEDNFSPV